MFVLLASQEPLKNVLIARSLLETNVMIQQESVQKLTKDAAISIVIISNVPVSKKEK